MMSKTWVATTQACAYERSERVRHISRCSCSRRTVFLTPQTTTTGKAAMFPIGLGQYMAAVLRDEMGWL
jgi:hypothetical protein